MTEFVIKFMNNGKECVTIVKWNEDVFTGHLIIDGVYSMVFPIGRSDEFEDDYPSQVDVIVSFRNYCNAIANSMMNLTLVKSQTDLTPNSPPNSPPNRAA